MVRLSSWKMQAKPVIERKREMKKKSMLLSTWVVQGTDYEEFRNEVAELTERTKVIKVSDERISILSHVRITDEKKEKGIEYFRELNAHSVYEFEENGRMPQIGRLYNLSLPDVAEETWNTCGIMIIIEGKVCYVSNDALTMIMQNIGLAGNAVQGCSLARDLILMKELAAQLRYTQYVYREDGAAQKLFAAFASSSRAYCYIPQTVVCDAIDALDSSKKYGRIVVNKWKIDNDRTQIIIEFPDIAKKFQQKYRLENNIRPGFRYVISDTGKSSVTIQMVWLVNGDHVVTGERSRMHKGTLAVSIDECYTEMAEELLTEAEAVPEKLKELDMRFIKGACLQNTILETVDKIFKGIHITQKMSEIIDYLTAQFPGFEYSGNCRNYSVYDLIISLYTIPGMLKDEVCEDELNKVRCAIGSSLFMNFNEICE